MRQIKSHPDKAGKHLLRNMVSITVLSIILSFSGCEKIFDEIAHHGQGGTVASKDYAAVATDWYKLQLRMILQANPAVPNFTASRLFAYTGITLYETARFEMRNSKSLQQQLNQMPVLPLPENNKTYSWVIAANAAMANITRKLFSVQNAANTISIDSLEKTWLNRISLTESPTVAARSASFGDSIAAIIFNWSKSDLYDHANDPYTPPVFPGAWVRTPPAFAAAATPYAGNCRTFMSLFSTGITPAPPFTYSEDPGSGFFRMVNNVYLVSKSLTPDQKNIALFWNDVGAGIGYTPMGHCISVLTQILDSSKASLATACIAYAKAGIALWDASVVCWRSKYQFNQIRPVTYIQQHIDNSWLPFIVTPSHPEYPAAHAFLTSAVMETLASVFGEKYKFTDHTYDFRGFPARSYTSFEQVALECGESRVYGGIHFQQSVDTGHIAGQFIGKAAGALRMQD